MNASLEILRQETRNCGGRWWQAYERLCGPGYYDQAKRGIFVDDDFDAAYRVWHNVGEYWRPRDDAVITIVHSVFPPPIQVHGPDVVICLRASINGNVKWRIEEKHPNVQAKLAAFSRNADRSLEMESLT